MQDTLVVGLIISCLGHYQCQVERIRVSVHFHVASAEPRWEGRTRWARKAKFLGRLELGDGDDSQSEDLTWTLCTPTHPSVFTYRNVTHD